MRTEAEIISSWKDLLPPLVTVICPTYNHERYLRQTIESILAQETDFPFEIIIHDDASTDSTALLVGEFEKEYPTIVRALYQEKNRYSHGVKITPLVIPHARGKFIAFCEGDDFWIGPEKLQKQVDILLANPELVVCGHLCRNVGPTGDVLPVQKLTGAACPDNFRLRDAMHSTPIHPSTWVYRRYDWAANEFASLLNSLPAADDPMMLILLTMGKGHCIKEYWSAYRIHPGGSWSTKSKVLKQFDMLRFHAASIHFLPVDLRVRQWITVSKSSGLVCLELIKECIGKLSIKPVQDFARHFHVQKNVTLALFGAATATFGLLLPWLLAAKIFKNLAVRNPT